MYCLNEVQWRSVQAAKSVWKMEDWLVFCYHADNDSREQLAWLRQ